MTDSKHLFVVGVGASEAGHAALRTLLASTPASSNASLIVSEHFDPQRPRPEAPGAGTGWSVVEATNGIALSGGSLYFAPPGQGLMVCGDRLFHAASPWKGKPSLDGLFRSLAASCQDRAIAILLAGSDGDGPGGLVDIRRAGGTVMVQDEASARSIGVHSSINPRVRPDYVLPPQELARALANKLNHVHQHGNHGVRDSIRDLDSFRQTLEAPMAVIGPGLLLASFNAAAGSWFGLRPSDLGKPIHNSSTSLNSPGLLRMIREVVEHRKRLSMLIHEDGRPYRIRLHPYSPDSSHTPSVILTATDALSEPVARRTPSPKEKRPFSIATPPEHLPPLSVGGDGMDSLSTPIARLDCTGVIVHVNQAWCEFAHANDPAVRDSGWIGVNYLDLCNEKAVGAEPFARHAAAGIRAVLLGDLSESGFEYLCSGEKRRFHCAAATDAGESGVVVMHINVTGAAESGNRLKLQLAALESVANVVFITNDLGTIEWVNAAFTTAFGYTKREIVGRPAWTVRSARQDRSGRDSHWTSALRGESNRSEVVLFHRDGTQRTMLQTLTPILSAAGRVTHCVAIQEDITRRKEAEWRILHMAQHDSLTGLPNRYLFHDRLRQAIDSAIRRNRKLALMLLDLDHFKHINDSFGHLAGDSLLVEVARRLESAIHGGDTLCRLGSDQFAVLAQDTRSFEETTELAHQVLAALHRPFQLQHHRVPINARMGIAIQSPDCNTAEALLRAADLALYRAKQGTRNSFHVFDSETERESSDRLQITLDLRHSLEAGELWVALQPQIRLRDGRLEGAEALLRWNHPKWGSVSPSRLISIAEDSGLIHQVGSWVLRQVCRQIREWRALGLPEITFSINLSAMQLMDPGAARSVLDCLQEYGIPPSWLQVEITESALLRNTDRTHTELAELATAGIPLVLDDFGTGYSSLTYLRQYPVRCLKVDMAFVQGVGINASDEEIITAIISLAHALGMVVVAEGVESDAQMQFLRQHQCDVAQGYYFGRAMQPGELMRLAASRDGWLSGSASQAGQC
ncbi:MAG: EAL domain-containing protein [Bryobacterales bacterium]|nr:EAL domain-containing protein [Bryobacterales bacterium]